LAFKTLFDLHDANKADGVVLVHGTMTLKSGTIADHAWLEGDGDVYDAVDHVTMPVAQYAAKRGAIAERRYTAKEVSSLVMRNEIDHYGPWHDTWPRKRHRQGGD
jgi:hypothetical protein